MKCVSPYYYDPSPVVSYRHTVSHAYFAFCPRDINAMRPSYKHVYLFNVCPVPHALRMANACAVFNPPIILSGIDYNNLSSRHHDVSRETLTTRPGLNTRQRERGCISAERLKHVPREKDLIFKELDRFIFPPVGMSPA